MFNCSDVKSNQETLKLNITIFYTYASQSTPIKTHLPNIQIIVIIPLNMNLIEITELIYI